MEHWLLDRWKKQRNKKKRNNTWNEMVHSIGWLLLAPRGGAEADTQPPAAGPIAAAAALFLQHWPASPPVRPSVCWPPSQPSAGSVGAAAPSLCPLSVKSHSLINDCTSCYIVYLLFGGSDIKCIYLYICFNTYCSSNSQHPIMAYCSKYSPKMPYCGWENQDSEWSYELCNLRVY